MTLAAIHPWTHVEVQVFGPRGQLHGETFVLRETTNAFEVLLTVANTAGFDVEGRFPPSGGFYVTSIDGFEGDETGGWTYGVETQDGRLFPSCPAPEYLIETGVKVIWAWTANPAAQKHPPPVRSKKFATSLSGTGAERRRVSRPR